MPSVFCVIRDMGSVPYAIGLAEALRKRGVETVIGADQEGRAAEKLSTLKETHIRLTDKAVPSLSGQDALVIGLGSSAGYSASTGIEGIFAREAGSKMPVFAIEDAFGSSQVRAKGMKLTGIIVCDEQAAEIASMAFPDIDRQHIVPVGHAASSKPETPSSLIKEIDVLRRQFGKLVVFTDGGPQAEANIRLFIECLDRTKAPCGVVVRLHPKFWGQDLPGSGGTYYSTWNAVLRPLMQKVALVEVATTDALMPLVDGVFSSYSTLLKTAAACGVPTGTLWTTESEIEHRREHGLAESELMMRKATRVIKKAEPLDEMLSTRLAPLSLLPFEADKAADAILSTL